MRRVLRVGFVALLIGLMAACGGDADNGNGADDGAGNSTNSVSNEATEIAADLSSAAADIDSVALQEAADEVTSQADLLVRQEAAMSSEELQVSDYIYWQHMVGNFGSVYTGVKEYLKIATSLVEDAPDEQSASAALNAARRAEGFIADNSGNIVEIWMAWARSDDDTSSELLEVEEAYREAVFDTEASRAKMLLAQAEVGIARFQDDEAMSRALEAQRQAQNALEEAEAAQERARRAYLDER